MWLSWLIIVKRMKDCNQSGKSGKPVGKSDLVTMVESSPDRGPDGTGYHIDGNAGFAHLAFHVTPESVNEEQPLISDDGRLVLVADVRLDNREELIAELGGILEKIYRG
jgi:asparagine synthase (glutamine-hydrolysing)